MTFNNWIRDLIFEDYFSSESSRNSGKFSIEPPTEAGSDVTFTPIRRPTVIIPSTNPSPTPTPPSSPVELNNDPTTLTPSELVRLAEAYDELHASHTELSTVAKELELRNGELERENAGLGNRCDELEAKFTEGERKLGSLRKEFRRLWEELKRVKGKKGVRAERELKGKVGEMEQGMTEERTV